MWNVLFGGVLMALLCVVRAEEVFELEELEAIRIRSPWAKEQFFGYFNWDKKSIFNVSYASSKRSEFIRYAVAMPLSDSRASWLVSSFCAFVSVPPSPGDALQGPFSFEIWTGIGNPENMISCTTVSSFPKQTAEASDWPYDAEHLYMTKQRIELKEPLWMEARTEHAYWIVIVANASITLGATEDTSLWRASIEVSSSRNEPTLRWSRWSGSPTVPAFFVSASLLSRLPMGPQRSFSPVGSTIVAVVLGMIALVVILRRVLHCSFAPFVNTTKPLAD